MVLQTWVAWVTKHYLNLYTMIPVTQVMGIVIFRNDFQMYFILHSKALVHYYFTRFSGLPAFHALMLFNVMEAICVSASLVKNA